MSSPPPNPDKKYLQQELKTHLNTLIENGDTEALVYKIHGSFRTPDPLTESDLAELRTLRDTYGLEGSQCYNNTQRILSNRSGWTYVEGYTYSNGIAKPIPHAWLERDGKLWELTFPWELIENPGYKLVYYGCEYSTDLVLHQAFEVHQATHPLASKTNNHLTPNGTPFNHTRDT